MTIIQIKWYYNTIVFNNTAVSRLRGRMMANLIEFFRMMLSYLLVFAVIVVVSGIGGFIGVKCWKPKVKMEKDDE